MRSWDALSGEWQELLEPACMCGQVGDQSLMALEGQAFLEQLHLDGCRRITDDGLAHIAGGLNADFCPAT